MLVCRLFLFFFFCFFVHNLIALFLLSTFIFYFYFHVTSIEATFIVLHLASSKCSFQLQLKYFLKKKTVDYEPVCDSSTCGDVLCVLSFRFNVLGFCPCSSFSLLITHTYFQILTLIVWRPDQYTLTSQSLKQDKPVKKKKKMGEHMEHDHVHQCWN